MHLPSPTVDQVERFRRDLRRLAGEPERVGIAVSGGPDSLALLLLASAAMPGRVEAATVDHRIRSESAGEAEQVERICRSADIPHAILAVDVDRDRSSLQRAAREARYAALAQWMLERNLTFLATAHHADDQAETLVMRLLRGSGLKGISSIRPRVKVPGSGGEAILIRPLLSWRRSELAQIVQAAGLQPVIDPSNEDERFDRARVRARLAACDWIDPAALARSATALGEAEDALAWTVSRLASERLTERGGEISLDPADLPAELRRRLVSRAIQACGAKASEPRGEEIGRLIGVLEEGSQATLGGILCKGGHRWTFRREGPRRSG